MHYRVTHTTAYEYTDPVSLCHNLAHLTPRTVPTQTCHGSNLTISPQPAVVADRTDYFGNPVTFFAIQEPHVELTLTATHAVEVRPAAAPEPGTSPPWEAVRDRLPEDRTPAVLDAYQYAFGSCYAQPAAELAEYARASFRPGRPLVEASLELMNRIHAEFRYDPKATTVSTPLKEVFARRRGVCQDFAHLQIACLRSLGLAARYVSGYLCTTPPPGRPRLVGTDATHAWLSVYSPGAGWVDLDPTNDRVPSDQHVVLAWGRDYGDVSPLKGVILGGGRHAVKVTVDVIPRGGPESE
jgi:transglutaminase-like putative cysteine protease